MQELVKQIWLKGPKTAKAGKGEEFSIAFSAIQSLFNPLYSSEGYSIGIYTDKPYLYVLFLMGWPQKEELERLTIAEFKEDMYRPTGVWETIEMGSLAGQRAQVYEPRNLSSRWSNIRGFLLGGCCQCDLNIKISNNYWIYEEYGRLHILSLKQNQVLIEENKKYTGDSRTNPLHKRFLQLLIVGAGYVLYPREGFHPKGTVEEASEALSKVLSQSLPTTQVLTTTGKTLPISEYVKLERDGRFGVARWAVELFVVPTVYGENPVYDGRGSYVGSSVKV